MDLTDRATERQLRDYDQAGVITAAKIANSDDGFIVVIQVSWKRGDIVVYNQRNKPRAWRSLDRLVAYLGEVAPSMRMLELNLLLNVPPEIAALSTAPKSNVKTPAKKTPKATAKKPRPTGKRTSKR